MIQIGIIGSGLAYPEDYENAYRIGKWIGQHGLILVNGGLGGIMEASAKGAYDSGGLTIGILPYSKKDSANPYIKVKIVTNMGHARNVIIAHTSDILVAIGGEYGTLSEIAIGLKVGKPVISFNSWDIQGVIKTATLDQTIKELEKLIMRLEE